MCRCVWPTSLSSLCRHKMRTDLPLMYTDGQRTSINSIICRPKLVPARAFAALGFSLRARKSERNYPDANNNALHTLCVRETNRHSQWVLWPIKSDHVTGANTQTHRLAPKTISINHSNISANNLFARPKNITNERPLWSQFRWPERWLIRLAVRYLATISPGFATVRVCMRGTNAIGTNRTV